MASTTSNSDYWIKQTPSEPAFPDLLWSRPENRSQAGKLLIIGGNSWGFAAPAEAYQAAQTAGIGTARVLLPESVHKLIGKQLEHAEAAASTPSGSFAQAGLQEWLTQAAWADAVLFAGDLGRNSETAIVLERFLEKYRGQVTLTKDAVDYVVTAPHSTRQRPDTLLVLSLAQLQKLAQTYGFAQAITFHMSLLQLVEATHNFTLQFPVHVITKHLDTILAASGGQVSTTKVSSEQKIWRVNSAAHAAVWWLQNPSQTFKALTISQHRSS